MSWDAPRVSNVYPHPTPQVHLTKKLSSYKAHHGTHFGTFPLQALFSLSSQEASVSV